MNDQTQQNKNEAATLDVSAVAADLGVSKATVLRWRQKGKLPGFFRIGQKWLVRREDYQRFIGERIEHNEEL